MNIRIVEIRAAKDAKALNTEWFVVENGGDTPFSTKNCILTIQRPGSKKKTDIGTMDPGFSLAPGQCVRVVTGNPARKAHGKAPGDDITNYNLFLGSTVLKGAGTTMTLTLRSMHLATAIYDPSAERGVRVES